MFAQKTYSYEFPDHQSEYNFLNGLYKIMTAVFVNSRLYSKIAWPQKRTSTCIALKNIKVHEKLINVHVSPKKHQSA